MAPKVSEVAPYGAAEWPIVSAADMVGRVFSILDVAEVATRYGARLRFTIEHNGHRYAMFLSRNGQRDNLLRYYQDPNHQVIVNVTITRMGRVYAFTDGEVNNG